MATTMPGIKKLHDFLFIIFFPLLLIWTPYALTLKLGYRCSPKDIGGQSIVPARAIGNL